MSFPKILLILAIFCLSAISSQAQSLSPENRATLEKMEDTLKITGREIINGNTAEERFQADSQFTRMLVRALKIKGSFHYPFDSLNTISRLIPKDSTFRIFTWQLAINYSTVRQHGAIQMNTKDGSLKLFPLIDKSPAIKNQEDYISNNLNWLGALYYMIVEKEAFGKKYYTLLGFDDNHFNSSRKIIEILTFNHGQPVFGAPIFFFKGGNMHRTDIARYIMTFKKEASPRLTYDKQMDMIVMEHLISETGQPDKKYTYIPDGDYEGLKWVDGKWAYINKIFNQTTPEGEPPVPHPLDPRKLQLMPHH